VFTGRVALGGEFQKRIQFGFAIGNDRIAAGVEARYMVADGEPFYGIGNGDEAIPTMPIDPLTSEQSVGANYLVDERRVTPRARIKIVDGFSIGLTSALVRKRFDTVAPSAGNVAIDEAYMVDRIPGFTTGTTFLYGEVELAYDSRHVVHRWDAPGVKSSGTLAQVFAGRQEGLLAEESGFFRLGFDVERLFRLTAGPRILALRAFGEMVTGDRDRVPFTELPQLGGRWLLRGYPGDRFNDRVAMVTQATYSWAASSRVIPSLFVDAGRVFPSLDAIGVDHLRVGYGAAIDLANKGSTFVRLQGASSIDGGSELFLSLNPDGRPRGGIRY
jgi:hypothetical protein